MIVLASASPRRAELLRNAGYDFEIAPAHVDETPRAGESPAALVARLSRAKAEGCASRLTGRENIFVLGADTVVTLDSEILNKPRDAEAATRMLRQLSGRTHSVLTGVCVIALPSREVREQTVTTQVTFTEILQDEIKNYVASDEPMDKAGAYAIQGRASRWAMQIVGDYFNVVGLPVATVAAMLESFTVIRTLAGTRNSTTVAK